MVPIWAGSHLSPDLPSLPQCHLLTSCSPFCITALAATQPDVNYWWFWGVVSVPLKNKSTYLSLPRSLILKEELISCHLIHCLGFKWEHFSDHLQKVLPEDQWVKASWRTSSSLTCSSGITTDLSNPVSIKDGKGRIYPPRSYQTRNKQESNISLPLFKKHLLHQLSYSTDITWKIRAGRN